MASTGRAAAPRVSAARTPMPAPRAASTRCSGAAATSATPWSPTSRPPRCARWPSAWRPAPDTIPPVSHLFAYLARMKFIKRWGLMHTTYPESIQEHSHRVAVIAHTLATIRNRLFGGRVDPARAAVLALYHDAGEVLTGDLPAPVKYFNPGIRGAYREIESAANQRLLGMVPEALREDYRSLFVALDGDHDCWELVKAADKLCA